MNIVEITSKDLFASELLANKQEIIIDASSLILGRLASIVAKLVKLGIRVHVVNVEKAVLTGDRKRVIEGYKLLFEVKTHKNPYRHAIHRPRHPISLFKRAVRNMLPKNINRRLKLIKLVKAYIGIPQQFEGKTAYRLIDISIDNSEHARKRPRDIITVAELAKAMGWNPRGAM
jgi:large subunit ribosomal protein L13